MRTQAQLGRVSDQVAALWDQVEVLLGSPQGFSSEAEALEPLEDSEASEGTGEVERLQGQLGGLFARVDRLQAVVQGAMTGEPVSFLQGQAPALRRLSESLELAQRTSAELESHVERAQALLRDAPSPGAPGGAAPRRKRKSRGSPAPAADVGPTRPPLPAQAQAAEGVLPAAAGGAGAGGEPRGEPRDPASEVPGLRGQPNAGEASEPAEPVADGESEPRASVAAPSAALGVASPPWAPEEPWAARLSAAEVKLRDLSAASTGTLARVEFAESELRELRDAATRLRQRVEEADTRLAGRAERQTEPRLPEPQLQEAWRSDVERRLGELESAQACPGGGPEPHAWRSDIEAAVSHL